tara:strand:- start:4400 stop:5719 length:1320 start_codon:yes stop_codon:yes gene_type:complete
VITVGDAVVYVGDCREQLKHLADNSVDSVVTDPPYELGFMGKSWDSSGIAYDVTVWQECLRVLKPGGHILAFGGSRTWHRLAVAVEDAGFELRDSIAWIYGSGFPKSLDVSKAIDKKAGAEREKIRHIPRAETSGTMMGSSESRPWIEKSREQGFYEADGPDAVTPEAKAWQGWGTALKPAFEPVVVGRKPFGKGVTVAENVLAWGVGGLNIDGSRIAGDPWKASFGTGLAKDKFFTTGDRTEIWKEPHTQGRWPANVILDEVSAGLLDEQSGVSVSKSGGKSGKTAIWSADIDAVDRGGHNDSGGASRFFYQPKASKRDRNEGLEELEGTSAGEMVDRVEGSAGMDSPRAGAGRTSGAKNFHPTVKPTALMRYLIKLVTPEGGTVLDPFTGSGSTGKAALLDGYKFVGVELTEEYLPIIEGRLKWASEQEGETDERLF